MTVISAGWTGCDVDDPGRPSDAASDWSRQGLDLLGFGLGEVDSGGVLVRANPAPARLLGISSGESGFDLQGLQWLSLTGAARPILSSLLAGDLVDEQCVVILPGGGRISAWVRTAPRRVDGQLAGVTLCLVALSEQVLASGATAAQTLMYQTLAQHLADVVLVMEAEVITWVSPSVFPVLGYQPAQLPGQAAPDLIHPDDMQDLVVTPAAPTMTGKNRMITADGSYKWVEFKLLARFGPDGSVLSVYSILRDISDRVQLAELVDAGRRRQRLALDASPDGFAIFRAGRAADGSVASLRLEFINAAGAVGFDGDPGDLIGQDLLDFFPEGAHNGVRADMVAALATGRPQQSWIRNSGGTGVQDMFAVQARLDESIVSTWRDVTEQVSHEARLAQAHAEIDAARDTLRAELNATSDGFVVFNIDNDERGLLAGLRVLHANTAAAAQFLLVVDEVIGPDATGSHPALAASGLWDHVLASIDDVRPRHYRTHVPSVGDDWAASFDNTIAADGAGRVVLTFRDATDDERARRDLDETRRQAEYAANHGPLTGLPNRILLLRRLDDALAECATGELVGVVFCDLNGFEIVNDTHGHAAGDAVLKDVALRLRNTLRPNDTAARLAGDEFVIVLRQPHRDWSVADFVRRISDNLSPPIVIDEVVLAASASIGVVLADPHRRPATDALPATVLAAADRAMYRNKVPSRSRRAAT